MKKPKSTVKPKPIKPQQQQQHPRIVVVPPRAGLCSFSRLVTLGFLLIFVAILAAFVKPSLSSPPRYIHPLLKATFKQRTNCSDISQDCEHFKRAGDCTKMPGWMMAFCAKTCQKCHLMLSRVRCTPEVFQHVFNETQYDINSRLFSRAGDLDRWFENLLMQNLSFQVLSRPPSGPWVVQIVNFLTQEEQTVLQETTESSLEKSQEGGTDISEEGIPNLYVSQKRTSSTAWCALNACEHHPVIKQLMLRVSLLLQIPTKNFETMQILHYAASERYEVHHDSNNEVEDMGGPRVLTFFLYLNHVQQGGETYFDQLHLKVKPVPGSVLLWPSVLSENPERIDPRMTHAALPVLKGEKRAANLWIHNRDFKTPEFWGCTT